MNRKWDYDVPSTEVWSEALRGAAQAGWPSIISIEGDAHYCALQRARLAHWMPAYRVAA